MQLILCEQTGDWAAALRGWLPPDVALVETRSLVEMWDQLEAAPRSLVVLELNAAKTEAVLAAIIRLSRNFPFAAAVVVMPRSLQPWEDAVREAGAIHVASSPRRLHEVAAIVQRRLQDLRSLDDSTASPKRSLEAHILSSLPWND